jgi:hypothetical protein
MMKKSSLAELVTRRQYPELEKQANEYIKNGEWKGFLNLIKDTPAKGKARDALVALLQLDAVGGTDSDVFKEFASLEGDSLRKVRADAIDHVMNILNEQIETKHTYFLDIEAMTMTPYVILVKDVIEARKRELEKLEGNPSRIDVLGTYYGFQILMTDGSKPFDNSQTTYGYRRWRRGTWLDEKITDSAANAVKALTAEMAEEVDMDKTYRTLGSSPVFKRRCTKSTADILANAVRLALYKVPGNRGAAARALGRTEDSRVLSFLHHRLPLEQNRKVRISIADALGRVGHESSIEILKERATPTSRYMSKEGIASVTALGGVYSPQSKETLLMLLQTGGSTTKAAAIQAISKQDPTDLVELISPYLENKSQPVVRASILSLADKGREGKAAIEAKAHVLINRIGHDKPSRPALIKMLSISKVAEMKPVHQYFAKRIEKHGREVRNWSKQINRSYSYYWRRREQRSKQKLEEYLRLVNSHLKPPFDEELMKAIESVVKSNNDPMNTIRTLGERLLVRKWEKKKNDDSSFLQTHLSSYV